MLRKKSFILRIGKYHVLLLQLNIYYKNSSESGWFNDHCLQELLMLLKEPIGQRFSASKNKTNKKTKKDQEVEIGTGTTMKFGFHFVEKEVYQPFVLPDNQDDKFRSLHLFEEKLKVTVCPTSSSVVDDLSTSILLSSSQLPKKQVEISDYFSKLKPSKLTTESAQKKKTKLKRIVEQGSQTSEADCKNSAGFIPDDGRLEGIEKLSFGEEMCGGFINDLMEEHKGNVRDHKCNTAGVENNKGERDTKDFKGSEKETGEDFAAKSGEDCLLRVCKGVLSDGSSHGVQEKENDDAVVSDIQDYNIGSNGGRMDANNVDDVSRLDEDCKEISDVNGEVKYANVSDITGGENAVAKCSKQDKLLKHQHRKCTARTKENLLQTDQIVEGESRESEKVQRNEHCSQVRNKMPKYDDLISSEVSDEKPLTNRTLLKLTNTSKNTKLSLDNGTKPSSTITTDDQRNVKSSTLQKVPKRGRRSKLSLKRQNKDNLKVNDRVAKKARRSTLILDETFNKESISKEKFETVSSTERNLTGTEKSDVFVNNDIVVDEQLKLRLSDSSINNESCQVETKQCHGNLRSNVDAIAEFCEGRDVGVCFQEKPKESHTNIENNEEGFTENVCVVKALDDDCVQETTKESHKVESLSVDKDMANIEEAVMASPKINQSDEDVSDCDLFLLNTIEDDDDVETLSDQKEESCIMTKPVKYNKRNPPVSSSDGDEYFPAKTGKQFGRVCKKIQNSTEKEDLEVPSDMKKSVNKLLRRPPVEVSSTDGEDLDNWPVRRKPFSRRFGKDKSKININKQALILGDEYGQHCTSSNDDDELPEVSVNDKKCNGGEVVTDVEVGMTCDDVAEDQSKDLPSFDEKQDEIETITMSPDLISDDEKDSTIIIDDAGFDTHQRNEYPAKESLIDLMADSSGDELPNVSFSSRQLHKFSGKSKDLTAILCGTKTDTSGDDLPHVSFSSHQIHQPFHQSKMLAAIPCGTMTDTSGDDLPHVSFSSHSHATKKADTDLSSPDPNSSPIFGKRKRPPRLQQNQNVKKCSRLNFESGDSTPNEEPGTTCVTKKPRFTFKTRGTLKHKTTNVQPAKVGVNSESSAPTATDNSALKEDTEQQPRKRFSQLWKENVNLPCAEKKKKTNLFSFGITSGGKKDHMNTGPAPTEIETISLLDDDEYESGIEESILQVRDVDGLRLEEMAFMVWKNEHYLRDIFQGKSHFSERHEFYKKGGVKRADLDFKAPLHMYSDEQVEIVVETLVKIFCSKGTKYWDYVMKVLLAEALIKIYMEVHHLSYNKAQEIIDEKKKDNQYV